MPGWMAASLVIGLLLLVGIPVIWLVFKSGYAAKPGASQRFRERQRTPDFELFRRHFECEPPQALRALLGDPPLFTGTGDAFDVVLPGPGGDTRWFVAWVEPVDAEHLNGVVWPGTAGYYAFANNGTGDKYLIDPRERDPSVLYYEHETAKTRPVGATLSQFIAARRLPRSED
jgi:hypothetical protein